MDCWHDIGAVPSQSASYQVGGIENFVNVRPAAALKLQACTCLFKQLTDCVKRGVGNAMIISKTLFDEDMLNLGPSM